MIRPGHLLRTLVAIVALVVAACTSTTAEETTTTTTTTTTATVPVVDGIDPAALEELRAEIDGLIAATEELRGLPFLEPPRVDILPPDEFEQRVRDLVASELVAEEVAAEEALYRLLGMLTGGVDLETLLVDLLGDQVVGFYDDDTRELVVPGDADLSVYERTVIVHELVHALGDQHFMFGDRLDALVEAEAFEEAAALQALVEGDATYFQFVYIEDLPPIDLLALGTEILGQDADLPQGTPAFLEQQLLFPYDEGFRLVERMVEVGGLAAVDQAYRDPPVTTEQVLHPDRYFTREAVRSVDLPPTDVTGYDVLEEGVFGELGIRLLLTGSEDPGTVTQVADGWGGDAYRLLGSGDDVAFVLHYIGDTERDAIELVQALIDHARDTMVAGGGTDTAGGIEFAEEGRPYVFIDRRGSEILFVAATDAGAGRELRRLAG